MTSPRETAEELAGLLEGPFDSDVALIIEALEESEREGYLRGIEDSANVAFESFGTCGECVSNIGHSIRALKDVKP